MTPETQRLSDGGILVQTEINEKDKNEGQLGR